MHIALTGASGFIGSVIARQAHAAGHTITALVRETSRRDHIEPYIDRFIVGTQSDESVFDDLLRGSDCIIHNSVDWSILKEDQADPKTFRDAIQRNLVSSLSLLHQAKDQQFLFISSIAVHHDMRPRWQGQIDEDHPLRPGGMYGAYKAAVEAFLHAFHHSMSRRVCAFRPCAVYGIDPFLKRSIGYPIIQKLTRGEDFDRQGGGKFVHVDDVAAAVVSAIDTDSANGHVFNQVDCYARWADWAQIAAELLDIDNPTIDFSSPSEPKNHFEKNQVRDLLSIDMDRGHAGIRTHLDQLINAMRTDGAI